MKFTLEIELGNEAMQTQCDIKTAIKGAFTGAAFEDYAFKALDSGVVRDTNGKTVGKWEVRKDAKAADTREAIKCPKCESGELQCVRDASVTRSVVGAIMKEYKSATGGTPYRYAEAELSDEDDVNTYDDYRLCCNECDETFSDEEVYDLVYPAEATPDDEPKTPAARIAELEAERDAFVIGAPDGTETPAPAQWAEENPNEAEELAALLILQTR